LHLDFLPIDVLKENLMGINGAGDALPVTHPAESKHCRELR